MRALLLLVAAGLGWLQAQPGPVPATAPPTGTDIYLVPLSGGVTGGLAGMKSVTPVPMSVTAGYDNQRLFSPDGARVLFAANCDGKQIDSDSVDRASGRIKQLTQTAVNREVSETRHDTYFADEIKGLTRFRANVCLDRKYPGAVFRVIPAKILTAEQLGLSPHILRDLETVAIAIETAETGHLVFGTLRTTTAVSTVDRVSDQFPQAQIRIMLSESLKGVIAQKLCCKIGGGRGAGGAVDQQRHQQPDSRVEDLPDFVDDAGGTRPGCGRAER